MSAHHSHDKSPDDLTPKDKAWWVECIASFVQEGADDAKPSEELTARIDAAIEKGQAQVQELLSKGRSDADATVSSMLKTISERLETIEKRLDPPA